MKQLPCKEKLGRLSFFFSAWEKDNHERAHQRSKQSWANREGLLITVFQSTKTGGVEH